MSTPEWHFLPCAIRTIRKDCGLTGPQVQRVLGVRGKSGFYRKEGHVVETKYGRMCFVRPPRLTVDTLSAVAQAMDVMPEAFFHEARLLRDEHDATVTKAVEALGISKDQFVSEVARGLHRA